MNHPPTRGILQCRDPKQPRREFVDMGRKSTSKYDNGKRITKPPRLSAPGTRFDGTQVCICYFRCTGTLLVHLLQCSCLMWECYGLVPSGLQHFKTLWSCLLLFTTCCTDKLMLRVTRVIRFLCQDCWWTQLQLCFFAVHRATAPQVHPHCKGPLHVFTGTPSWCSSQCRALVKHGGAAAVRCGA